jgi:threonine dehydratase
MHIPVIGALTMTKVSIMNEPTIKEIRQAAGRIRAYTHRTPVLTCTGINRMFDSEIFFKCENLQKAGSFKIRGATNAVFCLEQKEAFQGVATHSSGNHGAALALAATWRGIRAYIVMPENAPTVKQHAVTEYGAEIIFCKPNLVAREESLADVVARTGAAFIHPYNDYRIISGQGTTGMELCEDISHMDIIMTPVGGGGLLSGTALAVSALSPHTQVIGAEPEKADDAYRSLHAGRIIPANNPITIADGLRTSLGSLTFPIIRKRVKDILTVSEEDIISAMRLIWERMKIVVEPSAAVPLGALLTKTRQFSGKRIGIILSGGNVDLGSLPWIDKRE